MVLRLGEALGVSLRDRNLLLHAAGLPAAYPEADLRGPDLTPFRAAIDRLLHAHLPYPAMVVDACWNVLLANRACENLYGGDVVGANLVRRMPSPLTARASVARSPSWRARACASSKSLSATVNSPLRNAASVNASSAAAHRSRAVLPDWIVMDASVFQALTTDPG